MHRVYVDWNGLLADDLVPLNFAGTLRDLERLGLVLEPGLRLVVSDGELEADAVVETYGDGHWAARVGPISQVRG